MLHSVKVIQKKECSNGAHFIGVALRVKIKNALGESEADGKAYGLITDDPMTAEIGDVVELSKAELDRDFDPYRE